MQGVLFQIPMCFKQSRSPKPGKCFANNVVTQEIIGFRYLISMAVADILCMIQVFKHFDSRASSLSQKNPIHSLIR